LPEEIIAGIIKWALVPKANKHVLRKEQTGLTWEWSGIRNQDQILNVGDDHLRAKLLEIIEYAISSSNPYTAVKNLVHREDNNVSIGNKTYNLDDLDNVYIIGAGKATFSIALALEEILNEKITDGLVVLKKGGSQKLRKIKTIAAAHPVPDEKSLKGALGLLEIAERARENDLVIAAITGGSSSLVVKPAGEITLADKVKVNQLLLESGASIREINAVRKHISEIKGGHLGLKIFPAEIVNITVSDVVDDPIDYITDLTVPDTSTYRDAWNTMDKYDLWDLMPKRVCDHLLKGEEIETPKEYKGNFTSYICVSSSNAAEAAVKKCQEMGIKAHLLTTNLEGESQERAKYFVEEAQDWIKKQRKNVPYAVIASGETAVSINSGVGKGGPNQEFSLSAAVAIGGLKNVVVASVGTDGTDGPTEAAGGMVDGLTIQRASKENMDPEVYLENHNAYEFLNRTGDLLITGPTETNINDLILFLKMPD
jgi:glycerate 2-kinase